MPYLNGRKVSNDEWIAAKSAPAVGWKEATGWQDADEPQPEPEAVAPVKRARKGSKKAEAEAALAAVTGQDVDLDEIDAFLADTSEDGIPDPEDPA